ncbi:MAG: hypothetical protein A2161_17460 [Candidatus Schekmanbacteria bacterium RBG_13_48_7]|uniref:DNA 3'-5' helicase n=1 Tax=Candidatus Schekmanbacteria bacterium RBG_13_48_7 TaxID=1817878 RepID=A0A1F7S3J7_9BACT|nr:MAG: hypothetical protein A2161_17460 [Candidatus Schekmanbacteria bacterium RBG_13_48_7]
MKHYKLKKNDQLEPKQLKIDYEHELNESQLKTVETITGPLLVIAGAGTGKTRTLVYRTARLIESGIQPENILLLTFTRRAAAEILHRAAAILDGRCENVDGGTFHSFANIILRRYAKQAGQVDSFTIIDQSDSADTINLIRSQLGLTEKERRFPRKSTIQKILSLSSNTLKPLEEIISRYYPHFIDETEEILRLNDAYQKYKNQNHLFDYDDLLLKLLELLNNHENIRTLLSRKYLYIMVDEYQDTNRIQAMIVRRLAYSHDNVMVVGDDSQSIYSFRGANFENIIHFPEDFPDTTIITLEKNYRSTPQILNLTNEIIDKAAVKYPKNLYSDISDGELPSIIPARDEAEQSYFVASKVLELWEQGISLNQIAVLFRASSHSFALELELGKRNIPFIKYGGLKFIETAHVKDIICYLRLLSNSRDSVSWMRILLLLEGIGNKTAREIVDQISKDNDVVEALKHFKAEKKPRYAKHLKQLAEILFQIMPSKVYPAEKISILLNYYQPILQQKYDDYPKRRRDLEHLIVIAEKYRSLDSFLVDMALEPPNKSVKGMVYTDDADDQLILSTIHSAKGLEWHTVFILWAVDGKFPSMFSVYDDDDLEEERRLMYVACTRAKQNLFICYPMQIDSAQRGTIFTECSMFIRNISKSILEPILLSY